MVGHDQVRGASPDPTTKHAGREADCILEVNDYEGTPRGEIDVRNQGIREEGTWS